MALVGDIFKQVEHLSSFDGNEDETRACKLIRMEFKWWLDFADEDVLESGQVSNLQNNLGSLKVTEGRLIARF